MQSEHFLREVLDLGDRHPVVTHQDVFSANRIKLVKRGVRLTSTMYDRLVVHKLLRPIEHCLDIADCVSRQAIADRVRGLLAPGAPYAGLTARVSRGTLVSAFYDVELPARIACKLTVAREQRPRMYEHSVDVAVLAVYLAVRRGWDKAELRHAAAAGLLHDLGELHLDPALFDPDRALRPDEFEFIYSHPASGFLIIREHAEYPAAVRDAVLEHHERLDGSGYPRGLAGHAQSELGQMLAAAEVGAVLVQRAARTGFPAHLAVPIKMMWHKFDPQLIGFLGEVLRHEGSAAASTQPEGLDGHRQMLKAIADVLIDWGRTLAGHGQPQREPVDDDLLQFMDRRIEHLHRALMATGFDPRDVDGFVALLADDGTLRGELAAIAREAVWEFHDLRHETQRRWPQFASAPQTSRDAVQGWLGRAESRVSGLAPAREA